MAQNSSWPQHCWNLCEQRIWLSAPSCLWIKNEINIVQPFSSAHYSKEIFWPLLSFSQFAKCLIFCIVSLEYMWGFCYLNSSKSVHVIPLSKRGFSFQYSSVLSVKGQKLLIWTKKILNGSESNLCLLRVFCSSRPRKTCSFSCIAFCLRYLM